MKRGKGIVLLNGQPPMKFYSDPDDFIVCADGAYDWCKKANIRPDLILGDMDSVKNEPGDIPVLRVPSEKNQTDGELCLDFLTEKGFRRIEIWGAFGKRPDHFLGNLALLYKAYREGADCLFRGDKENMFLSSGKVCFLTEKKSVVSILPFFDSVHIMNSKGLKYPLDDLILSAEATRGISNMATQGEVSFEVKNGIALVFTEKWREWK